VLGIAALVGAAVAIVIAVLVSHADNEVTPLREETPKPEKRDGRSAHAGQITPWLKPLPRSRAHRRRPGGRSRQERNRKRHARNESRHAKKLPAARPKERVRVRLTRPAPVRRRSAAPPPLAVSAPGAALVSPLAVPASDPAPIALETPPAAVEPAAPAESSVKTGSSPETVPTPASDAVQIEIVDGELKTDLDRVHPRDGRVRLLVRTDELVVVDVEDYEPSWSIPAGGEALVEFEASSSKGFKLKLRHRKGVLVLRVSD
jgi:hypothetical protein